MLRIGVIGLGQMGRTHLVNALSFSNAEVVGVADVSKASLRKAKLLGVKNLYSDYKELLKNDLDAVIISLPNFMHCESVVLALEAGINVFVEKPLSLIHI